MDKEREKSKSINDFKRDLEGLIILIETFMEKLEQEKMGIEEPLEIFKYLLSILNRKKEKWEKEVSEIDVSKKQIEDKELINDTIAKYGVAHIINEKTKKTMAIINRSKKEKEKLNENTIITSIHSCNDCNKQLVEGSSNVQNSQVIFNSIKCRYCGSTNNKIVVRLLKENARMY